MTNWQDQNSRETAQRIIKWYERRAEDPKAVWGIPWPFPSLNSATGGIQWEPRPELTVLMSPPNVGKTAFAAKVTHAVATWVKANRSGQVVRAVLLEGSRDSFQDRMAHILANTSALRFKKGRASAEEWERYRVAQRDIFSLPIEYMDTDTEDVAFPAIRDFYKQGGNCAWGVLDHIGVIPGARDGYNAMATFSRELTRIARKVTPLMVLAHQQRSGGKAAQGKETTTDHRPSMENIGGAYDLAKDADLLLGLYRDDMWKRLADDQQRQPLRAAELIVIKQRNGPTGTIHMVYNTHRTEWSENAKLNQYWLDMLKE
jgi:replicative DNA helicase